jgi:prevent-host-death family protein
MRYTTSDLSRRSGDIIANALRHPVVLTQRGKPRLIMMSIEEFNQMRGKYDSRKMLRGGREEDPNPQT